MTPPNDNDQASPVHDHRLWRDNGWTARVIKNEDDEGWAVAMIKDGEPEPALVGPWTMGRDKKNPKPLDSTAFNTLVKTAAEVIRRHEQHTQAEQHREVVVTAASGRVTVKLDITPDDDNPYAEFSAFDATGNELARIRVDAGFRLTAASASAWIENEFRKPGAAKAGREASD
ncbi:MAG: hypothetical protein M3Z29_14480 [Pseudomonadota bacterium]|nr:hypothetical protein [Pseudomonadota bacterium]